MIGHVRPSSEGSTTRTRDRNRERDRKRCRDCNRRPTAHIVSRVSTAGVPPPVTVTATVTLVDVHEAARRRCQKRGLKRVATCDTSGASVARLPLAQPRHQSRVIAPQQLARGEIRPAASAAAGSRQLRHRFAVEVTLALQEAGLHTARKRFPSASQAVKSPWAVRMGRHDGTPRRQRSLLFTLYYRACY